VLLKLIKLFTRVVLVFVSLVLLIPIMVMLFLLTLISFQGPFTYVDKCYNNFVFVCKSFMFLLFSLSLILMLVHMWFPILPNLIF
jgi:hypothetical protein